VLFDKGDGCRIRVLVSGLCVPGYSLLRNQGVVSDCVCVVVSLVCVIVTFV
jgi:hypothetical protein